MTVDTSDMSAEVTVEELGWSDLLAPGRRAATALLTVTTGLYAFSEFFVSAAVPAAVREFGSPWLLPWSFIVFLVASITSAAGAASLKKRFGVRLALVGSNLVFVAGCLLAIYSTDSATLLVGRTMQGVGEGVALAVSYILIPQIYSGGLIARVFGLESVVWAAAAFAAPAAAGALTQYVSWRAPFAVSIPIAVLLLLLALFLPKEGEDQASGRTPWLQLVLIAGAVLVMSVTSMTDIATSVALLVVAVALAAGFLLVDRSSPSRILPVGDASSGPVLNAGLSITFFMPVAAAAGSVYFIYGLIATMGYEPLAASLVRSLIAISWSLTAFAVSNLKAKTREGNLRFSVWLLVAGYLLMTVAFSSQSVVVAGLGQVLVGISFGLTWGPLGQLLMERAPEAERDRTTALLPMLQSAGFAVGGALFGFVANLSGIRDGASEPTIHSGLVAIFALAIVVGVVAGIFNWRLLRAFNVPE